MATPEEQAIQGVIDQIWDTYDVDKSGALDKDETKKFVQDTLGNLGSGDEFSNEAFDEVFSTFDKDNSGTIEKDEMVVFIKQLLGGAWAFSQHAHVVIGTVAPVKMSVEPFRATNTVWRFSEHHHRPSLLVNLEIYEGNRTKNHE